MTPDEILLRYREQLVGASVRFLRLAGLAVKETFALLADRGFERTWRPVPAERTTDGRAQWLQNDGGVTTDPHAFDLYRSTVFTHVDHGLVEIFPRPPPWVRGVPMSTPWARKLVLYRPAVPLRPWHDLRAGEEDLATSFANRVFGVSDAGAFVPKSVRSRDGMIFDPDDLVRSHRLAVEVEIARSVVQLRP